MKDKVAKTSMFERREERRDDINELKMGREYFPFDNPPHTWLKLVYTLGGTIYIRGPS